MHWVRDCYYRSHEYYRVIKKPEFLTRLANVDFEDDTSMSEFRRFLDRPKIEKIAVGMLGNRVIALSTHSQHLIVDDPTTTGPAARIDNRLKVYETIFGVWKDAASRRAGNHSDEGYVSEGTIIIHQPAPLEVFCEIGTLYFREEKPLKDVTNTSHRRWLPANYVLVINIDDDSIWIIWNKSIMDGEGDYRAAKPDYQPWSLPGCPESLIYIAKLADGFEELGDQKHLSFRSVLPSSHFEIVPACYANGGGLRRLNDWRSKGKRDRLAALVAKKCQQSHPNRLRLR